MKARGLGTSSIGILILLCLVGTGLRLWQIGKASIWHDEAFSILLAAMAPLEIIERTARDFHPPLYYVVLHYWMNLFGASEISVRGLSAACTVAIIPVAYLLVKQLWDRRAGLLAATFVAVGPFLVRYGQEARMYGLTALLVVTSAYCLIRATQTGSWKWWGAYTLSLTAALYTHYYSIFAVVAFLVYMGLTTKRKKGSGLWNRRWWISNITAAGLFLPWLPTLYDQFTRNNDFSWTPAVGSMSLINTFVHFVVYGIPNFLSIPIRIAIGLAFIAACATAFYYAKKRRAAVAFLIAYTLTAPVAVFLLSLNHSIYYDRYFSFVAVGFYLLLASMVAMLRPWLQVLSVISLLVLFGVGNVAVQAQYTHRMKDVAAHIAERYQPGDYILAEHKLAFFDASYYNSTTSPVHLLRTNEPVGYGESSLYYDKANEVLVKRPEDIHPPNGRVWVISKLDKPKSFIHPPDYWIKAEAPFYAADNGVTLYLILSRSQ